MNQQTYDAFFDELAKIGGAEGLDKEAFVAQMYGAGKALATGAKGLMGGKTLGQLGHRMGQAYRGGVGRMGRAVGEGGGGSWLGRQRAGLGAMFGKGGVRGAAREQARLAKMTPEAKMFANAPWAQKATQAAEGGVGQAVKGTSVRDVALGAGILGGTGLVGAGAMKAFGGNQQRGY